LLLPHHSAGLRPQFRCLRTEAASDRPGCDAGRTAPAWRARRNRHVFSRLRIPFGVSSKPPGSPNGTMTFWRDGG
jgi:hypothetical protein